MKKTTSQGCWNNFSWTCFFNQFHAHVLLSFKSFRHSAPASAWCQRTLIQRGEFGLEWINLFRPRDEGDPFPIFILYPVKPVKVVFFHLNWNSTLHKKWSFSLRISSFFMQYYWPHVAQCEPVYFFLFPNNTVDFWTTSFKLTLL